MYPLSSKMQQRLTLQYLTAMGEYQEVSSKALHSRSRNGVDGNSSLGLLSFYHYCLGIRLRV